MLCTQSQNQWGETRPFKGSRALVDRPTQLVCIWIFICQADLMTGIELILAGMAYNVRRALTLPICLIVSCVLQVGKTGESVSYLFGF